MRAGVGAGVDGLFIEVHPEPGRALCDGANMIPLAEMKGLLKQAKAIHDLVAKGEGA
jgi:2-dehydro-3-deoxyphosphooctonate aldolase (KDO 8-P synthase)